jgi:hypothetical protein
MNQGRRLLTLAINKSSVSPGVCQSLGQVSYARKQGKQSSLPEAIAKGDFITIR